ncbi:MAG: glycerophosphodiester phosphodiesterase [bacterium]
MSDSRPSVLRIAHRGMPRLARENTLDSFSLALEAGADGIELDVHATSDGVVVVHHDPTLADGTAIACLSRAQLSDTGDDGPLVPTLADVFQLVRGRAELFVEIKEDGIEGLVSDMLLAYGGPSAIHSFHLAMIARLARSATPVRLGVLYEEEPLDVVTLLESHGALDLWPHHPLVTAMLVERVHAMGGRVIPWTVNDVGEAARLVVCGVDGLCSDDVRMLA